MAVWSRGNNNAAALTPPGVGNGASNDQLSMFADAAQSSGLAGMGMQMADQATGGMKNEDQVQMLYHLMATHPNEVALFYLEYPMFMKEFSNLIALVIRRELYQWFSCGAIPTTIIAEKALDYSSIIPLQEMQMKVHEDDMKAMNMMGGHQQQLMQNQYQQQQMVQQQQYHQYQQQMYPQQMQQQQQPPQRGFGSALGGFGSSLIRGTLGLPQPQQQYPQQGMMPPQ